MIPADGAAWDGSRIKIENTETVVAHWYSTDTICDARNAKIYFVFIAAADSGAKTYDGTLDVNRYDCDGTVGGDVIENDLNADWTVSANGGRQIYTYTLDSADIEANKLFIFKWTNAEGSDCYSNAIIVQYYTKKNTLVSL